jgi:hypothetical protein
VAVNKIHSIGDHIANIQSQAIQQQNEEGQEQEDINKNPNFFQFADFWFDLFNKLRDLGNSHNILTVY